MHDIRAIRADPAAFDAAMARRGVALVSAALLAQDADRRAAPSAAQQVCRSLRRRVSSSSRSCCR